MKQKSSVKFLVWGIALLVSLSANAGLKIQQWHTSKGAEVYFVENHDLPIIDISTNFYAGSARDSQEKAGVAGITRYMMTLGAGGLSEEQISNQMADIGAQMGGDFDLDRASFKLRTLSNTNEREKALSIYTKILQQPDFPSAVLAREKARIIAGLNESATQPDSISNKAFMKALYGKHPYAQEATGTPESVAAIETEDLKAFYKDHYGAKDAVVALIGDLTREQAMQVAESITANLPDAPQALPLTKVTLPERDNKEVIPHPASQSHILLGYPGIKRGDPDYFPLYVGNYILGGGGFVSRLTEEVREKRGLVYSVYSYFMPMAEAGPFQIGLQTKKEQSTEALKVVHETLDKFMAGGVTEAELKAAKQNIVGGFPLRLDSNAKILDYLAVIGFYHLPLTYLDDFNSKVSAVTTAQVKDAFNRRIDTKKLVTVIVGGE